MSEEQNKPGKTEPSKKGIGYFGWCEIKQNSLVLFGPIVLVAFLTIMLLSNLFPVHAKPREVIIYTSQDEEYSEPLFKDFEKKTGIQVKAVFDSEAVKT